MLTEIAGFVETLRLFDASNAFEEIGERRAGQVDDGDEGRGVSMAASA
jgi:hypothetical protein